MIGRSALPAALVLAPLLIASPVLAQSQAEPDADLTHMLGPSLPQAEGRRSDFVGDDGTLFPERTQGIAVATRPFVDDDGSRGTRTGLIGSMPVAPGTSLDLGLFRVNRISARERDLSRLQPMRDVNERRSTMAAVGLKVRFR